MKTAKDQKINYLKYEKEHRKPAMSRLLTAACLLWMFITAGVSVGGRSRNGTDIHDEHIPVRGPVHHCGHRSLQRPLLYHRAGKNGSCSVQIPVCARGYQKNAPRKNISAPARRGFLLYMQPDHLYRHRPWLFRFRAPLEHVHAPVRVCPALLSLPDCRDAGQRADPVSALRFTSSFPDVTTMVTPSTIRSTATIS